MTDANLMDANCIHGNVWYECAECDAITEQELLALKPLEDLARWIGWEDKT